MFKRTKIGTAAFIALTGSLALVSAAQAQETQRIEITGSAIKRIAAETAVPVTVIRAEELKQQGVASVEQILKVISSVQMNTGTSQVVGSGSGGASFADMRGIGANKTLVLLNGRRVANNAYDSSAPDLNMIPFDAIERIEVLRDGASSLYGTDAVGGVINFITRSDFTGGLITIGTDKPEAAGGEEVMGNVALGFGDLRRDRFNIFGVLSFHKSDSISGIERDYNLRQPGGLSPTPYPANYYQVGDIVGNPAAPNCSSVSALIPTGDGTSCTQVTSAFVNYTPKSERSSVLLRGSLAVGSDHTLSLEWFSAQNKTESVIAPVPYGTLWVNPTRPDGTANPFYPGNAGSGITTTPFPLNPTFTQANMTPRPGVQLQPGFVTVKWRDLATGQRTDLSDNKQQRFVAQMEGLFGDWDYRAGLSYNENKVKQNVRGYSNGDMITLGMLNGIINPFGAQDAAGAAFIASAGLGGNLQNAIGKVTALDAKASRELGDWFGAGTKAALALGVEARKEDFWQAANTPFASLVAASTGIDPESVSKGKRDVTAVFAELSVPLIKQLDATVAVRHDRYSDFGSTTNPKFTLRYQPMDNLVLRATYGTGFRAPSLYEINAAPYYTNTGTISDPVNCPNGTTAIPGKSTVLNCNVQFQAQYGGNTSLKPEESKNYTFGIVFEPTTQLSLGLDFWRIEITNQIGSLSEYTVVQNPGTFAGNFRRNSSGDLSIDGFSCPGSDCGYLDLRTQNLGDLNASGVDISAAYRMNFGAAGSLRLGLNSTYVSEYEYQDYTGGPFNQNVGAFVGSGPIFRWQHNLSAVWNVSKFTLGWSGAYKSNYLDQYTDNTVSPYFTMDAYMGWEVMKGLALTFGIRNLADKEPPFSNQDQTFQANYDPRFTDPTGRKYYLRAKYQF